MMQCTQFVKNLADPVMNWVQIVCNSLVHFSWLLVPLVLECVTFKEASQIVTVMDMNFKDGLQSCRL